VVPQRASIDVNGNAASYLTAGDGPVLLLLHGTYWSRVWQPIIADLARGGLRPVAVDLPGCGRSAGELGLDDASVPALAAWVAEFTRVLSPSALAGVAGHDIGGAIAQRLLITGEVRVERIALINSVTYDSWPVPGVARYRDPAVIANTETDEILAARRVAITAALARPANDDEVNDYLEPWTDPRVARSWMALAGAADNRYTVELLDSLRANRRPKLLIWGHDDQFQPISYARRFAAEMPETTLVSIPRAGHIPMENEPSKVAATLVRFFLDGRAVNMR
jgi:pimeloyl-ACP methyl ester carboxylesterase